MDLQEIGGPSTLERLCFSVELECHWLGPNLYVFPALELGYRDLGIGAVTILVAGERAGETREARGGIQAVTQRLAPDVDSATIFDSYLFDAGKQHVGGIKGVSVEYRERVGAKLIFVGGLECLVFPTGERDIWTGEEHTLTGITDGLSGRVGDAAVGS